jgi:hypothetical protein
MALEVAKIRGKNINISLVASTVAGEILPYIVSDMSSIG